MPFPARIVGDPACQQNWEYLGRTAPSVVSKLPSNPRDGQEVYFLADAASGVMWHLRYRSASASAYKWEYLGGPPLEAVVASTNQALTSTAVNVTGLSITAPLNGEYDYAGETVYNCGSAFTAGTYCGFNGSALSAANAHRITLAAGAFAPVYLRFRYAINAGQVFTLMVTSQSGGVTANLYENRVAVTPVRVG